MTSESARTTIEAVKTAMVLVRADENDDWIGWMEESEAVEIRDFGLFLLNAAHGWLDSDA